MHIDQSHGTFLNEIVTDSPDTVEAGVQALQTLFVKHTDLNVDTVEFPIVTVCGVGSCFK